LPAHNKILNDCRIGGRGLAVLSQQLRAFDLALAMVERDLLRCAIPDAQDDRERVLKHTSEGRVAARQRGAAFGRRPKLIQHQQREALARLRSRTESARQIAKSYNVSHSTISRLAP
jgi:DNA invertase Pin-like site-specific DNA recombinase